MIIAWYMDGYLPWRLAVLDEADDIAVERLRVAEDAVAALPRGTPERRKASRLAAEINITRASLLRARDLLAPRYGAHVSERVLHSVRRLRLEERAAMQSTPAKRLRILAFVHPWTSGVRRALLAMSGIEQERMNRNVATSEGT